MTLAAYAALRTFFYVVVFFVVTFLVFFSIHAATHPHLTLFLDLNNPDATQARHTFVFEKPVIVQYVEWMQKFFTGDLGTPSVLGVQP